MASIVNEILSYAGKLDEQEIGARVELLKDNIDKMKASMQEYVQKRYVEFLPSSIKTSEMFNQLTSYTSELNSLILLFENELSKKIDESAEELQEINDQLISTKSALSVVKNLISIHDSLLESQKFFNNNDFEEAVECLQQVESHIKNLKDVWKDQIKLLTSLITEYHVQNEKLKYDMGEIWKNSLKWDVVEKPDGDNSDVKQIVELSLNSSCTSLSSLVHAMSRVNYLQQNLQLFAKRLLQYVIEPIITKCTQVTTSIRDEKESLKIIISNSAVQPPNDVFEKLTIVFDFLFEHQFGTVTLPEERGDEQLLMQKLGSIIYKDFCELLIKECLSPAIPSRRQDLKEFDEIVVSTSHFNNHLMTIRIIGAEDKTLIDYAMDVDSLFVNKMCQTLLVSARKLMLSDLHKTITVTDSDTQTCDASLSQKSIQGTILEEKHSINMFGFPACEISKSAKDLVDLLNTVMEDATTSSLTCATKLVMTARNILTMYCDMVTCYHKESLETMPLCSALFHNNCMYIAHHTMTMGQKLNTNVQSPLRDFIVTFVDYVPKLRDGGTEVFLAQMRNQRQYLLDFLHEAGDFRNMANDEQIIFKMEKAIKKCIMHLEHLSKMWKNVLCTNVYLRAIGTLLNSVLEEIITQITNVEDLSATQANQLISIFENITSKTLALFIVDNAQTAVVEAQRAVFKWNKFTEMILVLNASLQNILDRWANGKGPLAQEFATDEIKQMIRALFQNTDRRAAVLAKIK